MPTSGRDCSVRVSFCRRRRRGLTAVWATYILPAPIARAVTQARPRGRLRLRIGEECRSDQTPPRASSTQPPDAKEVKRLRSEYGLEKPEPSASRLAYSGLEFGGIVTVSILLGLWLDAKFGTKPWWLLSLT